MNKRGFTYMEWLLILGIVIIVVVSCAVPLYIYSQYGDTPVSEMPMWVWWYLK